MRDILNHGERVLSIKFSVDASAEIIDLCDRMPYFLHLLAKHAAKAAMEVGAPTVEIDNIVRKDPWNLGAADQQLRTSYDHAIMADGDIGVFRKMLFGITRPLGIGAVTSDPSIYQRTVWALANLPKKGNSAAEIASQADKIRIEASDGDLTEKTVARALRRLNLQREKGRIICQPSPGRFLSTVL